MKFLIKPFPEIMIKSKPVKKRFMQILWNNIRTRLKQDFSDFKVQVFWDKLEVSVLWESNKTIVKILSRIPWIEFFLEVLEFDIVWETKQEQFDFIFAKAKDYFLDKIENKSFVSRVKRSWKHDYNSIDLERYIWGGLLKFSKNASVKLKNPDITVNIEIKDSKLFLVVDKHFWIGGYPVWTQDKVLTLISGWFDSWVSSFSLCKRWAKVDYLFFNLWWTAHELWVKQVAYYLWKNFSSGYNARFITINFDEIVKKLVTEIDHKYRWIILKRLFLMAADSLAKEHKYYAIVKWDSLWQVSSQTLKNMFIVDKASSTLVLRPLISFNKQEIVDLSKKIWTYEFACNMPEYCWVISDKPATAADLEKVLKEEENFDFELLQKAIENKKVQKIDEVLSDKVEGEDVELCYVPWEWEIVIDIREEADKKKNKLVLDKVEILEIPFFDINSKFPDLDQSKIYLFYCDKWVLSRLHAQYLKEQWFNNIKVYRYLEKWCSLKD